MRSDFLNIGFYNYLRDWELRAHSFVIFLALHKEAKQVLSKGTNKFCQSLALNSVGLTDFIS